MQKRIVTIHGMSFPWLKKNLFTAALEGTAVLLAVTSRIVIGYFESKCTKTSTYLLRGYSCFPKKEQK
jgi:hypothetical protein